MPPPPPSREAGQLRPTLIWLGCFGLLNRLRAACDKGHVACLAGELRFALFMSCMAERHQFVPVLNVLLVSLLNVQVKYFDPHKT